MSARKRSNPADIKRQQREIAKDIVKRSMPRAIDTAQPKSVSPPVGRVLSPRAKRKPIVKGALVTGRTKLNTI